MTIHIKASKEAKARKLQKSIECSNGSVEDMIDAFEDRINYLNNDIDMAIDIEDEDFEDIESGMIGNIANTVSKVADTLNLDDEIDDDFEDIEASVEYYQTDPRNLISEEDMYAEVVGGMLNLMSDYDMDLDEAGTAWVEWIEELVARAKRDIESGKAKSTYDR